MQSGGESHENPLIAGALFLALAGNALAGTLEIGPTEINEWKAVYGRVEARDNRAGACPHRGTVEELLVTEGDVVSAGQKIALVRDEKIGFRSQRRRPDRATSVTPRHGRSRPGQSAGNW